jgi:integrase
MKVTWDTNVRGLHTRHFDSKSVYMLYYRTRDNVQRRPKIGEVGKISLAEARKRCRMLLERVALGEDPKGEWDVKRAEITVDALFDKVWIEHWGKKQFKESGWSREVAGNWLRNIKKPFGRRKLSAISQKEIRGWHKSYEDNVYAGNRSLEILSKMFNYAIEDGILSRGQNPCIGVKTFKERKRKRYATKEELTKILSILNREAQGKPQAVAFIYLLIFTGARPRSIERATHDCLVRVRAGDREYGVLTFKGKSTASTGEEEQVILPSQALSILDKVEISADKTLTGIKFPRDFWQAIRKEAGCNDLWARDFRRTFATIGLSHGQDVGVISEILNHKSTQTTKIYAKLMQDSKFRAVDSIADCIQTMIGAKNDPRANKLTPVTKK